MIDSLLSACHRGRPLLLAPVLAAGLAAPSTGAAAGPAPAAALPAAELFVRPDALSGVTISPSGKRVAMIVTTANGRRVAATADLPITGTPRVVAAFSTGNVDSLHWVNDDRVVYQASDDGPEVELHGAGTFAVDHDGSNLLRLITAARSAGSSVTLGSRIRERMLPWSWQLHGLLHDGGDEVLAAEYTERVDGDRYIAKIVRLNTRTGVTRWVSFGAPAMPSTLLLDAQGDPRLVRVTRDGRHVVHLRQPGTERWEVIADMPWVDTTGKDWVPVGFEGKDQLVVQSRQGGDTEGYYLYDLGKRRIDTEPLVSVERFDAGEAVWDEREQRIVAVRIDADRPMTVWLDARLESIQRSIDGALPGRFNHLSCSSGCASARYFVVFSSSDRHPGEYLVYDATDRRLSTLGAVRPEIDEASQGQRSFHWVKTRDGLEMPVIVTHPPNRGRDEKLPAVVLVHGGPWVRGSTRAWDAEAQFLASRGWRVLQPEFRGSMGFGFKHFSAGFKQWGLAMQDDLLDTVQWAAQQGLVDVDRVCLYGGSYGGYAALMGPIRHPRAYRCSASFAGVTDIELIYTSWRSDISRQSRKHGMPTMVGDPVSDRQQLQQTSPLRRAAEIKVPVLLAHGAFDRRVPPEHADKFASAARNAGVPLERVNYSQTGHGWHYAKDHQDFLEKLERFLANSLNR